MHPDIIDSLIPDDAKIFWLVFIVVNIVYADDLMRWRAESSSDMILTWFVWSQHRTSKNVSSFITWDNLIIDPVIKGQ